MSKLTLTHIKKSYKNGEVVHALKGISLAFRESELVSILGPSGCGKTTLLNMIGGLDRYDSGDMTLSGMSTKDFKDSDWDAYRNNAIGFVFQDYNLIVHQTVLQNVELAMTLSGVTSSERRRKAKEALESVGLTDQLNKKPNQLSGGQMQRVAIARALVNNPEIILADEPTGALDSTTSVQIMEILKEISKTRLVIMVTHNKELAQEYSSRIISLKDGTLQSDTNPLRAEDQRQMVASKGVRLEKTAMSFITATALSFRNLLTKKGRTAITAISGSIGIIGVALVLALSTGLSDHMSDMQEDTLANFPITISERPQVIEGRGGPLSEDGHMNILVQTESDGRFPTSTSIYPFDRDGTSVQHTNVLTEAFLDYVTNINTALPNAVSNVSYTREVEINVLARGGDDVIKFDTRSPLRQAVDMGSNLSVNNGFFWTELFENEELSLLTLEPIGEGSRLPSAMNEVAIVVDDYNRIDYTFFEQLGIVVDVESFDVTDFIGETLLTVILNDDYYTQTADGLFEPASVAQYQALWESGNGIELTVVGILRRNETTSAQVRHTGFVYTTALTDYVLEHARHSEIAQAQLESDRDVLLNAPFANDGERVMRLRQLGADQTPTNINIYPRDYEGKIEIMRYLDAFNVGRPVDEQIVYTDMAEQLQNMLSTTVDTVAIALTAFASISLIVSTLMIAVITYVSVLERTKEIGILRSVGARKKDISRVFNAEAMIVGLVAGVLGIIIAFGLSIPMDNIIYRVVGIRNIMNLSFPIAAVLILGSVTLTFIAGLIPSKMASKKDPVKALKAG